MQNLNLISGLMVMTFEQLKVRYR